MESTKRQTGLRANHMPFKTVTQIPTDLIVGEVPYAWLDAGTEVPMCVPVAFA